MRARPSPLRVSGSSRADQLIFLIERVTALLRADGPLRIALLLLAFTWAALRPARGKTGNWSPGTVLAVSPPARLPLGKIATGIVACLVLLVAVGGGAVWARHHREMTSQAQMATGGDPARAVGIMIA